MTNDPLVQLKAAIVLAAQEREDRETREEQAAKERRRDQARDVWAQRKKELPAIVEAINSMLKDYGYEALTISAFDSKHSDVDRTVIDFAHSPRSHTKILLCVTTAGEFSCAVGAAHNDAGMSWVPIEQLSEDRLKEVVAKAVEACLSGKRDQRAS